MKLMEPWKNMDTKLQTVNILFKGKDYERIANMIKKIWEYRKVLLKPPQENIQETTLMALEKLIDVLYIP